ncbi:glycoside hydrolase superfamily [Gongronella butleri]|nr:glycoside hydrolase superfamily [Gongronella butleri]
MYISSLLFVFYLCLVHAQSLQARGYSAAGTDNLVFYWGQGGRGERDLGYYCQQPGVSIMVLAFVNDFVGGPNGQPKLNLAGKCSNANRCERVARDIQKCQKMGIKVLMSIGGAAGPYRSQKWNPDILAAHLWTMFLGGANKKVQRPFGNIKLDGIDFDPEATSAVGYDRLIHRLRSYFLLDTHHEYVITAAPQCPDLDAYSNNAMFSILHPNPKYDAYPDMVFVQFYNNVCSASEFGNWNRWRSNAFNFDRWNEWAEKNTNHTTVYLGLLGKQTHHDSGYVPFSQLTSVINSVFKQSRYAGVMMWDAAGAYSNPTPTGRQYGHAVAAHMQLLASNAAGSSARAQGNEFSVHFSSPLYGWQAAVHSWLQRVLRLKKLSDDTPTAS